MSDTRITNVWQLLRTTYTEWIDDKPFRQSALIAYYAILSLPGILLISVQIASFLFDPSEVQAQISGEFGKMIGPDAAELIENILQPQNTEQNSLFMTIVGLGTIIYGATGFFYHLQQSLNHIWGVKPNPNSEWLKMLKDRGISLALVLIVALLLLISLVFSTIITALSDQLAAKYSDLIVHSVQIIEIIISMGFVTVLMALIYKILPDAKIQWRDVWMGAFVTALLFVLGKVLLSLYFSNADPGSTYGAAGSLILIMLWVSYSGLIVFFGAEFTQCFARFRGRKIVPTGNATYEKTSGFK